MASDRLVRYIVTVDTAGALVGMDRLSKKTDETASKMEAAGTRMRSIGNSMTAFGRSLSYVSLPVAALGGYAVKSAVNFQTAMTLIQTQAKASGGELKYLQQQVMALGKGKGSHGFGPQEIAEALYPIRSDGFKAAQALNVLQGALEGSAVSGANLTLTANALGGALRVYGVSGPEAVTKAMNSLNNTVGFGKMKFEELDEALTSGFLQQAHRSGVGLDEIGIALDSMSRRSVPPIVEATRLQKTLIQFGTVTGVAKKALGSVGISQLQLAEDMKKHGLIFALEDMQRHLNKIGGPHQKELENVIVGEAFGRSKGSANVGGLLEMITEMRTIQKEREKASTLQEALAKKETTSQYKISEAIGHLKFALLELGEVLIPIVIPMFQKVATAVQDALKWFTKLPKPIRDIGVYLAIAAVVAGPFFILFGNLIKVFGIAFKIIPGLTKLFPQLGAAVGEGSAAASGGIAALLPEIAALVAAAAAVYAIYKGVKALKEFLGDEGHPKSRGARAFNNLPHHSNAGTNLRGALAMVGGGHAVDPRELEFGGRGYAQYLKEHARAGGTGQSLEGHGGGGGVSAARSRQIAQDLQERNEFIVHTHVHLDAKQVAEVTSRFLRDNPSSKGAKHLAEAVLRNSHINNARMGNP